MALDRKSLIGLAESTGGGFVRATMSVKVKETLKRAILSGRLPGGTHLGLVDLAEAFNVSTTPVREALLILASEGFVELDPYRGAIVHSPSREEAEEVIRLRQALEPLAMEEAVRLMTPDTVADAKRVLQTMLDQPDSEEWVEANKEFHEILYRGVRSQRLLEILRSLRSPIVMYVSRAVTGDATFRERANEQHARLFQAVVDGDVDTAKYIIVEHVALPMVVADSSAEESDQTEVVW